MAAKVAAAFAGDDEATKADISYIYNKATGVSTKLRRERNVWVLDAWIDESPDTGFARQD